MSKRSNEIWSDFRSLLNKAGYKWTLPRTKRAGDNIYEFLEPIKDCIVYFKICYNKPCWWGVTKNRVEELKISGKRWFLILLYESAERGYFLIDEEVHMNIPNWSLSRGDFKVLPARIQTKRGFNSFSELDNLLREHCKSVRRL